ncbi:hypothetical protein T492DRAFT_849552 [Pavlovales sp. CCMP2436]|nr:hypothetical protein T492DRAFT_849552 [Pavlovales sp. CCMP2436]
MPAVVIIVVGGGSCMRVGVRMRGAPFASVCPWAPSAAAAKAADAAAGRAAGAARGRAARRGAAWATGWAAAGWAAAWAAGSEGRWAAGEARRGAGRGGGTGTAGWNEQASSHQYESAIIIEASGKRKRKIYELRRALKGCTYRGAVLAEDELHVGQQRAVEVIRVGAVDCEVGRAESVRLAILAPSIVHDLFS